MGAGSGPPVVEQDMGSEGVICGCEMSDQHELGPQGGDSVKGKMPAWEEATANSPQHGHSNTGVLHQLSLFPYGNSREGIYK